METCNMCSLHVQSQISSLDCTACTHIYAIFMYGAAVVNSFKMTSRCNADFRLTRRSASFFENRQGM
eukprot:38136-Amphidinium_carterae.1